MDTSFQSAGIRTLPLHIISGNLHNFSTVKSTTTELPHTQTQVFTPVPFWKIPHSLLLAKELPSGNYVAYSEVAGMCYPTQCT